jgi:hypothetical protein
MVHGRRPPSRRGRAIGFGKARDRMVYRTPLAGASSEATIRREPRTVVSGWNLATSRSHHGKGLPTIIGRQ